VTLTRRARRAGRQTGRGQAGRAALAAALGLLSAAAPAAESWIKPKASESLLLDIAHNGEQWLVVGERGHVLRSTNAEDWEQVRAPTRVMLTAVALNERGLGVAVGHEATILRSVDHGESWQRVYHDPGQDAPLLDVEILDGGRVVAVGAYGLYLESDDAGESWQPRALDAKALESAEAGEADDEDDALSYDVHLNNIAAPESGRWYIAAEAGTVYRSDDAGRSWLRLPSPYAGSFHGVMPINNERVMVFGLQGRLFESRDAGVHWRRLETGTQATLASGGRLSPGRVWIAGYAGVVLRETGSGLKSTRIGNRPAIEGARVLEGNVLLTVGEGGVRRWPAGTWSVDEP